jgi:hypothetical protein
MFTLIDKRLRWMLLVSVIIGLALLFNVWESLRGDYGWRWGYAAPDRVGQWLPSLLAVIVYVAGAFFVRRRAQVIGWALLGSALLPFIFLGRWGEPLEFQFDRVASGTVSGPHLIAHQSDDFPNALKNWPDEQQRFADEHISIHGALAPPGLPLLYYGASRALDGADFAADPLGRTLRPYQCHNLDMMSASNAELASAWLGMASPIWAALAIFPLFWLGRRLTDEQSAHWMALAWALIPGIAVFTPVPNTVFPTMAIFCVWLLWTAMERRSYGRIFAAGLVASAMTFLNFSVLPLLLFCGLLALGYHLMNLREKRFWSMQVGAVFGAGLVMVWLVWMVWGGPPPSDMLQTAMDQHLTLERPYLPWLFLHLWDYALFFGLPLILLSLWSFGAAIPKIKNLSPIGLFAICLGLTLLIVDISGTARGETGRVWQFFFPMSLIIALAALRDLPPINHRLMLITQGFFALVLVLYVPVINNPIGQPPPNPPEIESAAIEVPTEAQFADSLHLTGFGGAFDESNNLVLDLRWQTQSQADEPFYFAVIPVAPDGTPYQESMVFQPFETAYPVTCWQPGQEVIDRVTIPLEGDPPAGEWWVSLSTHGYFDFEPLPVTLPDGSIDTQAGIGPFSR